MSITKSKRNQYIASHLEPETKAGLRAAAKRHKKSASKYIAEAVEEKLEREGEGEALRHAEAE